MRIEPILGLKKQNQIIPEREFPFFSIFQTEEMIREYFGNYGYHFIGMYDNTSDLVIVKYKNRELENLLVDYDLYKVYHYKTKTIYMENIPIHEVAKKTFPESAKGLFSSFQYRIIKKKEGYQLIDVVHSIPLIDADQMYFLDGKRLFYSIMGLESIFHLDEKKNYPLLSLEENIYIGSEPKTFVDMRYHMYYDYQNTILPVSMDPVHLRELVEKYPYGEKIGNHFRLLSLPICYGIFYENDQISHIHWYDSIKTRDDIMYQLGLLVPEVLEFPKEKQKHIDE